MSEQFGIMELSDEIICQDELQLYHNSMATKESIINAAAEKLNNSQKYQTHQVANRLIKLFPDWKRSTIYNALNEMYKRNYEKDTDTNETITLFDEIFYHLIDSSENLKKFAKSVIKRANESEEMKQTLTDILTDSIHNMHKDELIENFTSELSKIRQLKDLVEFVKTLAFDSQLLADKTDARQKIDMALKVGLKLKLTQHLPRELAIKLKISPKWLSQIDHDDSILSFIDKVPHCPKCSFNFSDYINNCNTAESKGLPYPVIK